MKIIRDKHMLIGIVNGLILVGALAGVTGLALAEEQTANNTQRQSEKAMTDKIEKTDEQWRKELSPEQYE
jgi:gas vesicle protein